MTHEAAERGERLTVHNANKAQLKWMVQDREEWIDRLWKENQELNRTIETLCRVVAQLQGEVKTA